MISTKAADVILSLVFSCWLISTQVVWAWDPSTTVTFTSVATASGLDFEHTDGRSGRRLFNEFLGSGGGFFDYDNDNDLDIYLVNACPQLSSKPGRLPCNTLYRNNGDGTFTDVTSSAGVGDTGYGVGCAVGDYDNDGHVDLYVTNFGSNVLYHNNGNGTFSDVSLQAGVANARWGTSCAFADLDQDGFLDLYVANYADYAIDRDRRCEVRGIWQYCGPRAYPPAADVLYHNNGNGTFTDRSRESGILIEPAGHSLGLACGDYDKDGYLDLYIANDQEVNLLWRNQTEGRFENAALLAGVGYSDLGLEESGMGTAFGDYDNDGWLDLTVSNFQRETNTIYRNQTEGFFADVTIQTGVSLASYTYLGWGIAFFDYDNDGYKDIFVSNGHVTDNIAGIDPSTTYPQRNMLLRNQGDGTFEDVTDRSGPGLALRKVSRGAAFGDYDNDGDIDILVTNWNQTVDLLRNDGGNRNHWLQIETVGVKSNRSGIGARIKIVMDSMTQYAEVHSSGSYLSCSDFRLHFGLGQSERVRQLQIQWPSGQIEGIENLPVNRRFVAEEGQGIHLLTKESGRGK